MPQYLQVMLQETEDSRHFAGAQGFFEFYMKGREKFGKSMAWAVAGIADSQA